MDGSERLAIIFVFIYAETTIWILMDKPGGKKTAKKAVAKASLEPLWGSGSQKSVLQRYDGKAGKKNCKR